MAKRYRWYRDTTKDPADAAAALAAAGVLTAASWNPVSETIEEALDRIARSAAGGAISWTYPAAAAYPASDITDQRLAGAWRYAFRKNSPVPGHGVRLLVDAKSTMAVVGRRTLSAAMTGLTSILATPTVMKRLIGRQRPFGSFDPGDIASVTIASFNDAIGHSWNWPLRMGVLPAEAYPLARQTSAVGAARHGFLRIEPDDPAAQDVFVVVDAKSQKLREIQERAVGVALIRAPQGRARNSVLQQWMSDDMSVPAAFLDVDQDFMPDYLNNLTYEISHNKPLDVAVFDGYSATLLAATADGAQLAVAPPVLFGPRVDANDTFEDARLVRRVQEMTHRLERLDDNSLLGAPVSAANALGITDETRTVGEYRAALTKAFVGKNLDFTRESDGATALQWLDQKVGGMEAEFDATHGSIFKSVRPGRDIRTGSPDTQPHPDLERQEQKFDSEFIGERSEAPGGESFPGTDSSPPEAPSGARESAAIPSTEARRYTDITLFEDHLYPRDDPAKATVVADDRPLIAGKEYTLGVAIRLVRTGIDSASPAPRGVINPRKDCKDLSVYVFVRPKCPGLEIKEPFAAIVWPYARDSDTAFFRITVSAPAQGLAAGPIDVLLYDSSLDLLDIVGTTITVVDESQNVMSIPPRTMIWPEGQDGAPRIDPRAPVRLASINVSSAPGGYRLDFKFLDSAGKPVVIPVYRSIGDSDLRTLLERVRNFWTTLVITNYAKQLAVTHTTFKTYLAELANIGRDAARLLFGDGYGSQKGSGETISDLLAAIKGGEGGRIQITYSDDARGFVFPWNIVYPREAKEVDVAAFWGVRHQIEQVRGGSKVDALDDEPINVTFALDPSFGNSQQQKDLFDAYSQKAAASKLVISAPVDKAEVLFSNLSSNPASHLYYFFCHGWAPGGFGVLPADSLNLLREQIEKVDKEQQAALQSLLALLPKMGQQPWIFIGNSQIDETALQNQNFFERRRPIVFLNMCHSAGLLPSMNSGLVRTFLARNAAAVIGTESPMTPIFAHEFAHAVLDQLLGGSDVGTALWLARRRFIEVSRNPLGLAYTLYGRATARIGSGPIIAVAKPVSSPT